MVKYAIFKHTDNRTQEQKLFDLYHDYHVTDGLYCGKICRGIYLVPEEYKSNARTWKTKEAAEKVLEKLQLFDGTPAKDAGYFVTEIK